MAARTREHQLNTSGQTKRGRAGRNELACKEKALPATGSRLEKTVMMRFVMKEWLDLRGSLCFVDHDDDMAVVHIFIYC
jgi:hypothetical protein